MMERFVAAVMYVFPFSTEWRGRPISILLTGGFISMMPDGDFGPGVSMVF
jgi:hypothetical protein